MHLKIFLRISSAIIVFKSSFAIPDKSIIEFCFIILLKSIFVFKENPDCNNLILFFKRFINSGIINSSSQGLKIEKFMKLIFLNYS